MGTVNKIDRWGLGGKVLERHSSGESGRVIAGAINKTLIDGRRISQSAISRWIRKRIIGQTLCQRRELDVIRLTEKVAARYGPVACCVCGGKGESYVLSFVDRLHWEPNKCVACRGSGKAEDLRGLRNCTIERHDLQNDVIEFFGKGKSCRVIAEEVSKRNGLPLRGGVVAKWLSYMLRDENDGYATENSLAYARRLLADGSCLKGRDIPESLAKLKMVHVELIREKRRVSYG